MLTREGEKVLHENVHTEIIFQDMSLCKICKL